MTNQSINQSIDQSINRPINQSINQWIKQASSQSINQPINWLQEEARNQFWFFVQTLMMKWIVRGSYCIIQRTPESSYAVGHRVPASAKLLTASPIILMKSIKNAVELDGMYRCHVRDGAALAEFFAWMEKEVPKGHVTELSAAAKLEDIRSRYLKNLDPQPPKMNVLIKQKGNDHVFLVKISYLVMFDENKENDSSFFVDQVIRLIVWLVDRSIDWLIDWLSARLIDWLIDCVNDWLIDWLIAWMTDRLIECLIGCFSNMVSRIFLHLCETSSLSFSVRKIMSVWVSTPFPDRARMAPLSTINRLRPRIARWRSMTCSCWTLAHSTSTGPRMWPGPCISASRPITKRSASHWCSKAI